MTRFNNPLTPKFTRLRSRSSETKGWIHAAMTDVTKAALAEAAPAGVQAVEM